MTDLFIKAQKNIQAKEAMLAPGRVVPAAYQAALKQSQRKNAKRDTLHLHPSELCKKDFCPRSAWYKIKGYEAKEGSTPFSRLNVFAEGNHIHDKWQRWLAEAGILWGDWQCPGCDQLLPERGPIKVCYDCGYEGPMRYREVPIEDEEHMLLGHADGVIWDDLGKAVLEIKSIGIGTVRFEDYDLWQRYNHGDITVDQMWRDIKAPFPSHVRQVTLYMHCLGIHDAVIIYESKMTQEVKEFSIKYNASTIDHIFVSCRLVKEHIETDRVPYRPIWAENSDHKTCKYCPYRSTCWKEDDSSTNATNTEATVPTVVLPSRTTRKRSASTPRVIRSTR